MQIEIQKANRDTLGLVNHFDSSFIVTSRLEVTMQAGKITYQVVRIPSFRKVYPPEDVDYATFLDQPDRAIYFAYVDGEPAGQIILTDHWNRFGYIQDIVVNPNFRGHGIGSALIEQAIMWAKERELPGLMLETQDINVNACKLYERKGFQLSGFDRALYDATLPGASEVALYWYLLF